jgi:hypothetical protein
MEVGVSLPKIEAILVDLAIYQGRRRVVDTQPSIGLGIDCGSVDQSRQLIDIPDAGGAV